MKHWKQFQVYSIKDTYAGWPRCVVKDEDGLSTEIRIANLPAEIPKFIEQYRQLEARIARLRSEIEARERSVREASAVTPIATSDPQRQIQRERVNLAAERVRQEKEDLAKLEEVRKQMFDKSGNRTSILAMFSGRKYGSLDVWDCGRQKQ